MDNNYGYNQYEAYNPTYATTESNSRIMIKSFVVVIAGLIVTALASTIAAVTPSFFSSVMDSYFIWVIAELVIVLLTSAAIAKQSAVWAGIGYFAYSVVNGITLSLIFYVYELGSIYQVFFIAAAMFAGMALIGLFTNMDLTKIGSIGIMLLWGVIISTLINMIFIKSTGFDMVMNYLVVAIFCGLTAWDVQNLKKNAQAGSDSNVVAIYFGMQLYLDFINIFIRLLAIMGKRR